MGGWVGGFKERVEGADGGVDGAVVLGGEGDPVDEAMREEGGLAGFSSFVELKGKDRPDSKGTRFIVMESCRT